MPLKTDFGKSIGKSSVSSMLTQSLITSASSILTPCLNALYLNFLAFACSFLLILSFLSSGWNLRFRVSGLLFTTVLVFSCSIFILLLQWPLYQSLNNILPVNVALDSVDTWIVLQSLSQQDQNRAVLLFSKRAWWYLVGIDPELVLGRQSSVVENSNTVSNSVTVFNNRWHTTGWSEIVQRLSINMCWGEVLSLDTVQMAREEVKVPGLYVAVTVACCSTPWKRLFRY